MTQTSDPQLVDAMWRAADLTRAYLVRDRGWIATCLSGLGDARIQRICGWLILDHDRLFDELCEPSMAAREIYAMAALAPLDTEAAVATAVQRVTAGETGIARAVENLEPVDQVHAIAISMAVMLLEALGYANALRRITADTAHYEQLGHPRPYKIG